MATGHEYAAVLPDDQQEAAEATEWGYELVEKLETLGITNADITKLKGAGFHTCKSLLQTHPKHLKSVKGLTEPRVEKILALVRTMLQGDTGFRTAQNYLEDRKTVFHVTSGSTELDNLIGGGFESQMITELHGEWRTGKTQICHTLCVTAQLAGVGGYGGGKVVYIDTEGTFRPERLEPICTRFGADYSAALGNIMTVRVYNSSQLMECMVQLSGLLAQEPDVFRVIIVDSIIATFRTDYSGRGELAERQQTLNQLISIFRRLAEEWNVAIVFTNQMSANPAGGMTFVADPKQPVGGHILAHGVQARIYLKKGGGESRIAKLVDSPQYGTGDCVFTITPGGVADE